jgi:hypothetical protein
MTNMRLKCLIHVNLRTYKQSRTGTQTFPFVDDVAAIKQQHDAARNYSIMIAGHAVTHTHTHQEAKVMDS